MKNFRTRVWFLFLTAFLFTFSIMARAETVVEEKKAAANYDETFPVPEESRADEEASSFSQTPEIALASLANATTPEAPPKETVQEPV
ncbi:MAG: hypothetical protein PHV97_05825 [Candidatus Omnitrophica bacterium]|nr:hypothetical protein [Candidatus Omnitrophota bacterium]